MSGKVTPIDGAVPEPRMRQVVSYEVSPLFIGAGQSERYNPDDLVTTRGLRIYRQMMFDEQVKAVMTFKRDAITSRGWTFAFDSASKLSPEEQEQRIGVLGKCIERMRGSFEDALNCIARGRTYGFSLTEIVYDNIAVDAKQYIGIHSLRARDPATFVFHTDEYGTLKKCVQRIDSKELEIDLKKFVHYVHNPEEDAYYGQSDLRQAWRAWYIKDQVIKLYGTYLERFAGGFAALELQEGSSISPGSQQHDTLKDILRNLRNMSGMILPPHIKLNMVQPGSTAEYREALTYFDLAIAKALLVPNLLGLSHTGQTGAYAQSQTQLEAFFWTLNADTRRLEACLHEQLFRPLCAMNWGDDDYPRFAFKPASQEQVRWLIDTWAQLVGVNAVETTAEDEAHLRKLLEMPARDIEPEDEQDEALASDAKAAFDSGQITAMLEVLAKVADKTIPKESAIALLVEAFPINEEDAGRMVNPVVPRDPPEPTMAKPNGAGNGAARRMALEGLLHEFYSDDQPREPAGSPTGGQWIPAGGPSAGAYGAGLAKRIPRGTHPTEQQVRSMYAAQGVPPDKVEIREATMEEALASGFQTGDAWYNASTDTFVMTPHAMAELDVHKIATVINHEVSHRWFNLAGGRDPDSEVGQFLKQNYGALRAEAFGVSKYANYFFSRSPSPRDDGSFPTSGFAYSALAHAMTEGLSEIRRARAYEGRPTFTALDKLIHDIVLRQPDLTGLEPD